MVTDSLPSLYQKNGGIAINNNSWEINSLKEQLLIQENKDAYKAASMTVKARDIIGKVDDLLDDVVRVMDKLEKTSYEVTHMRDEIEKEINELLVNCIDDRSHDVLWNDNMKEPCVLYYIFNKEKTKVKIGISKNPLARLNALQTACGEKLEILHTVEFPTRRAAMNAETSLHNHFNDFRICEFGGARRQTEWFRCGEYVAGQLVTYFDTSEKINSFFKINKKYSA